VVGDKDRGGKYSIDTAKEVIDAKKKASKGKARGITFRPYVEDIKARLAKVEEKRAQIIKMGSESCCANSVKGESSP